MTAVMKPRHALSLLALVAGVMLFHGEAPAAAVEEGEFLRVYMNQARVLRLDRPVAKVIVGNSEVADATVADAHTIVLTGKSYGTTNLVLLDTAGNPIVDERVLVSIDENDTVRVYKQTVRSVYSCTPYCEYHQKTKP